MARKSWIQDPETGELIPKEEYHRRKEAEYYIQGDIEPFVSPIDKSVITDRAQLRAHNAKHGVTDMRDYSPEYMEKKHKERHARMIGQDREGRQRRLNHILEAIERHGG